MSNESKCKCTVCGHVGGWNNGICENPNCGANLLLFGIDYSEEEPTVLPSKENLSTRCPQCGRSYSGSMSCPYCTGLPVAKEKPSSAFLKSVIADVMLYLTAFGLIMFVLAFCDILDVDDTPFCIVLIFGLMVPPFVIVLLKRLTRKDDSAYVTLQGQDAVLYLITMTVIVVLCMFGIIIALTAWDNGSVSQNGFLMIVSLGLVIIPLFILWYIKPNKTVAAIMIVYSVIYTAIGINIHYTAALVFTAAMASASIYALKYLIKQKIKR